MVFFINQIIEASGTDLSKDSSVHNKFTRFSKGKFHGPVLKIVARGSTITIKGSLDCEDTIRSLVISLATSDGDDFLVTGKVEAFEDPTDFLNESVSVKRFAKDVRVEEKTTKSKQKWEIEVSGLWNKKDLALFIDTFSRVRGYNLLKVESVSSPADFTVKSRIPRSDGEYTIEKATKFCTGKIESNEENWEAVIKQLLPDMEATEDTKSIIIEHDYDITEIVVPPDAEGNKRLAAFRKGTITRKVTINGGEPVQKTYPLHA